jgi:hypothetical protein
VTDAFAGIAAEVAPLLTDEATVYTRQAAAPRTHTVVATTGLACRLTTVVRTVAQTGGARIELAQRRQLYWRGADYALPANAQGAVDVRIVVNGRPERWGVDGVPTPLPPGAADPELWIAELLLQPN